MSKTFKIVELRAENYKRLSAVSIRPDGNVIQLGGANAQGKTSVLDAIWCCLAGKDAVPAVPIRQGQEEAVIKLDLGTIKVTRTFKAKEDGGYTTSLKVDSADMGRLSSPQAVLDAMVGSLTFDPLAFTRMDAKAQFNTLRSLVPGVDFDEIARQNRADFESRTIANRRAKEFRTQADAIQLPPGAAPKPVDVSELTKKLSEAHTFNADIERRRAARQGAKTNIESYNSQIAALQKQIEEITALRDEIQTRLDSADALPEPVDVAALTGQLNDAAEINRAAEAFQRRADLEASAKAAETEAANLTKAMEGREEVKRAAISAAKMPVEGLGFGDDCILLHGLPFDQASSAQQLRASMAIAAALNPKLRIIRVKDGALLDEQAMSWLAEFAEAQDMQVWIERVGDNGGVGLILEDGHIRGEAPALGDNGRDHPATQPDDDTEAF